MLREILRSGSASSKARTVWYSKGDTLIHMLVSNRLCLDDWRMGHTSLPAAAARDMNAACGVMVMAMVTGMDAICLALSPDNRNHALEACMAQKRISTGATPLNVALASGANNTGVGVLLVARPSARRIEDGRGMLPLNQGIQGR